MIYGHTRPASVWSVAGANSPAFETDVRLDNSQPSEQTVISGIASSSPTTAEYFDLIAAWAVPQAIGVVGILKLSCAPGVRIVVTGRRLGDGDYTRVLGGNSDTITAQIGDGRVQSIIVPTATETDYIGLQLRIYNDAGGVTWADDETDLLIGEVAIYAATKLCARPARSRGRTQRSQRERASNGAAHIYPRGDYRTESLSVLGTVADAYKGGLPGGVDFARLQAMQDAYRYRALVIPRGENDYNQGPDYDLIQQKALFCLATWGQISEEADGGIMRVAVPLELEEAL